MCVAACWLCRICCLGFIFGGSLVPWRGHALTNWVLTVASLRGCSRWGSCPFVGVVAERQAAGVGDGAWTPGTAAPALAASLLLSPLLVPLPRTGVPWSC